MSLRAASGLASSHLVKPLAKARMFKMNMGLVKFLRQ